MATASSSAALSTYATPLGSGLPGVPGPSGSVASSSGHHERSSHHHHANHHHQTGERDRHRRSRNDHRHDRSDGHHRERDRDRDPAASSSNGRSSNYARHGAQSAHSTTSSLVNGGSGHVDAADDNASSALDFDNFDDEDIECPLCLDEMDLSDLNFKPCPCGYQICRFCWHNIKENLNGRCPACRRQYDDSTVEFKAMKPEELKRLQAAKRQKEKEKKELEITNRRHLSNVRVKQKNQVHITGLTTKYANEDTLHALKGSDHYGQYGKIAKMFVARKALHQGPSPAVQVPTSLLDSHYQPVNVYINYEQQRDAAACMAAVDGSTTADGLKLRATWGTTKYCTSYLRGQKCAIDGCMQAHETGEEVDGPILLAKEEISSMQHAAKQSETRAAASSAAPSLPASASWAKQPTTQPAKPSIQRQSSIRNAVPARPLSAASNPTTSSSRRSSEPQEAKPVLPSQPAVIPAVERLADVRNASNSLPALPPGLLPATSMLSAPPGLVPAGPPGLSASSTPISDASIPLPASDFAGFDQTLDTLADGGFSFSLDPDIVHHEAKPVSATASLNGSTSLLSSFEPGILTPSNLSGPSSPITSLRSSLDIMSIASPLATAQPSGYTGSFDPFAEVKPSQKLPSDDETETQPPASIRQSSRFGFARQPSSFSRGLNDQAKAAFLSSMSNEKHAMGRSPSSSGHFADLSSGPQAAPLPDAATLFPGVDLDASYSSALPPVFGLEGPHRKSPSPARHPNHHPLAYNIQHDPFAPQYAGNELFNDPAIVNMRNARPGYVPPFEYGRR
ncbi:uncharacterized protein L969DRAFT_89885 [Mixia osmundae IAM 14324]|uniref:RING-type domain-containing protein n=1 Tax=Mixia osmundae (strain CBS 9802 / IAM 14324 / JCM 22182 / KY 12970) TaxID=764103 RepID=G7DWG6_MIXOS|nr:uncharacterized protein L969DRAFT_89885 [Mixia osmundae IAM 14324]KEI37328.1 hypothetical protein L969DRAFT_89885 [Mixia osmundae IAM 14324]GAA94926.1 hypothetical protein E5Q_01581 [Mixia osmundae IAM 14324]